MTVDRNFFCLFYKKLHAQFLKKEHPPEDAKTFNDLSPDVWAKKFTRSKKFIVAARFHGASGKCARFYFYDRYRSFTSKKAIIKPTECDIDELTLFKALVYLGLGNNLKFECSEGRKLELRFTIVDNKGEWDKAHTPERLNLLIKQFKKVYYPSDAPDEENEGSVSKNPVYQSNQHSNDNFTLITKVTPAGTNKTATESTNDDFLFIVNLIESKYRLTKSEQMAVSQHPLSEDSRQKLVSTLKDNKTHEIVRKKIIALFCYLKILTHSEIIELLNVRDTTFLEVLLDAFPDLCKRRNHPQEASYELIGIISDTSLTNYVRHLAFEAGRNYSEVWFPTFLREYYESNPITVNLYIFLLEKIRSIPIKSKYDLSDWESFIDSVSSIVMSDSDLENYNSVLKEHMIYTKEEMHRRFVMETKSTNGQ
jgi:hypothetical protein